MCHAGLVAGGKEEAVFFSNGTAEYLLDYQDPNWAVLAVGRTSAGRRRSPGVESRSLHLELPGRLVWRTWATQSTEDEAKRSG